MRTIVMSFNTRDSSLPQTMLNVQLTGKFYIGTKQSQSKGALVVQTGNYLCKVHYTV